MKVKATSILASLALATVFVAGCTEEAPPEPKGAAPAPAVKPAAPEKPAAPPAATPEKPK